MRARKFRKLVLRNLHDMEGIQPSIEALGALQILGLGTKNDDEKNSRLPGAHT